MTVEDPEALNERLEAFRREELRKQLEREREGMGFTKESDARFLLAQERMFPNLKHASLEDYKRWLKGYLSLGNESTHYYDYPFSHVADEFYSAIAHFEVVPLFGAQAISIIVPESIIVSGEDKGHSNLYFEEGFRVAGKHPFVPIYSDIKF